MLLIPAIDLKDGQCVRLKQGDMDQATIFQKILRQWPDIGSIAARDDCIWSI